MAEIIKIADFSAPELDVFARLTERELFHSTEEENGVFIAESPNVIHRALDAGYRPISLLMEESHVRGQAKAVIERCGDVPVYVSTLDVLTQLTGFQLTRGVLCAMERKPEPDWRRVVDGARRITVLEEVVNPTNLGAIFRSAAALGMDAVLVTPGSVDPLYRRCVRVSMGTVFQVPWTFCAGNTPALLERLKKDGFVTAAMALKEDSMSVDDPVFREAERLAVVIGNEGEGLAPETIEACSHTAMIPMSHGVDSLNAAAASAVAFWAMRAKER